MADLKSFQRPSRWSVANHLIKPHLVSLRQILISLAAAAILFFARASWGSSPVTLRDTILTAGASIAAALVVVPVVYYIALFVYAGKYIAQKEAEHYRSAAETFQKDLKELRDYKVAVERSASQLTAEPDILSQARLTRMKSDSPGIGGFEYLVAVFRNNPPEHPTTQSTALDVTAEITFDIPVGPLRIQAAWTDLDSKTEIHYDTDQPKLRQTLYPGERAGLYVAHKQGMEPAFAFNGRDINRKGYELPLENIFVTITLNGVNVKPDTTFKYRLIYFHKDTHGVPEEVLKALPAFGHLKMTLV